MNGMIEHPFMLYCMILNIKKNVPSTLRTFPFPLFIYINSTPRTSMSEGKNRYNDQDPS